MSSNLGKVFWRGKFYPVISSPFPHILVETKKELHGWWRGKRECTSERFLINPYNGCSIGCKFCYSRSFPGWFQFFKLYNVIVVAKDFDKVIEKQLDSIDIVSCGYLSPVTDPFQPLNEKYRLSEKIIEVFLRRNIPIEFITKAYVPEIVLDMIKEHPHCFGQVSILTFDEKLKRILVPNGASIQELFSNIRRMARRNIFSVCRIDPIFPYLTDDKEQLKALVKRASDSGVRHIIASILDIPVSIKGEIFKFIKDNFGQNLYKKYLFLYQERIDNYLNANIDYRLKIFDFLRTTCDKKGISFALCMEYKLDKEGNAVGLNRDFMSSVNCEGIDIPIYKKKENKFYPAANCNGNCLNCKEAICGISDLAMGKQGSKKDWRLKDYKRWSTGLE
jgi:DNA repair photolyase